MKVQKLPGGRGAAGIPPRLKGQRSKCDGSQVSKGPQEEAKAGKGHRFFFGPLFVVGEVLDMKPRASFMWGKHHPLCNPAQAFNVSQTTKSSIHCEERPFLLCRSSLETLSQNTQKCVSRVLPVKVNHHHPTLTRPVTMDELLSVPQFPALSCVNNNSSYLMRLLEGFATQCPEVSLIYRKCSLKIIIFLLPCRDQSQWLQISRIKTFKCWHFHKWWLSSWLFYMYSGEGAKRVMQWQCFLPKSP